MDPETAKLVAAITGSAGVLGAIVGASIAALSGWIVAKTNMAAQRAIANDTARREWRTQAVRGLLEVANSRPPLYAAIRDIVLRGDTAKFREVQARMVGDQHLLSSAAWPALMGFPTSGEIPAFLAAEQDYLRIASIALQPVSPAIVDPTPIVLERVTDLAPAHEAVLQKLAALNLAAERYIFGDQQQRDRRLGGMRARLGRK
jgi:hypothetical protein